MRGRRGKFFQTIQLGLVFAKHSLGDHEAKTAAQPAVPKTIGRWQKMKTKICRLDPLFRVVNLIVVRKSHLGTLLGFSFALLGGTDAQALGFRIPNQDAEATARGNAFVATADNPAALYYNPAGITQLEGLNAQYGAHIISVNSDYHSASGVSAKTEFEIQPVPQFYATYTPKESHLSYGLGVYVPFGLGLEWPDNTSFRTLAIEGRLTYTTLNPVVAWQLHRTLSIAIGPTLNYSQVKVRQGIGLAAGDEIKFRGDDFDFGFSAGVMWRPHPQWSFGASYRSATSMNYSGSTETHTIPALSGKVDTKARVEFPQIVMSCSP